MTTNILKAIQNLVRFGRNDLPRVTPGANRANSMGSALEVFLKDIFCGTLNLGSNAEKERVHNQYLSYRGNQNNPPDFIMSGGDAVEVKKIEGLTSAIALNSSYPKQKLYSESEMITDACRVCEGQEQWDVKDIIYAVGTVKRSKLKLLGMVYGDCYAADRNIYESLKDRVSQGIAGTPDVHFSPTNELARVNQVDPLGITCLRIRGMWGIENPMKVFGDIVSFNRTKGFTLYALMRVEKYNGFPACDRRAVEALVSDSFVVMDVEIKDPDNPAHFLPAKLIRFEID